MTAPLSDIGVPATKCNSISGQSIPGVAYFVLTQAKPSQAPRVVKGPDLLMV